MSRIARIGFFLLAIVAIALFWYFFISRGSISQPPGERNGNIQEEPAREWKTYASAERAFSIQYPPDFMVNESYRYANFSSGKEIPGIAFVVPRSFVEGTNLSDDTYASVEFLEGETPCDAASFLEQIDSRETVEESGISYDVAKRTGAAAGNRYEEIVYLLHDCVAIRYFIHSGNIGNYESGTTREFDRDSLIRILDRMRRSYQYYAKG